MADFLESRLFAWAELVFAGIASLIWFVTQGAAGPWPLLIGLVPAAVRLAGGRFPIRRTQFDGWLLLFLLTAVVGVWVAYDPTAASHKLWLIVAAILFYYALAAQPTTNIWPIAALLGGFGVVMSAYYLFTHDWITAPSKFEPLNSLATRWMAIRPDLPAHDFHSNIIAGLVAISFPFMLGWAVRAWRERRFLVMSGVLVGSVIIIAGLLLTTSRGAWLALTAAMGFWFLWSMSRWVSERVGRSRMTTFLVSLLAAAGLALALTTFYPGGPVALLDNLPGPASASNRVQLYQETIDLIADFPLTGAGLATFPGLYSQYILVLPFFILPHGHNVFLDVALEQGLLGFLALATIALSTCLQLKGGPWTSRPTDEARLLPQPSLMRWTIFAAALVMILHGLVEDSIYESRGLPYLFVMSGMTVAVMERSRRRSAAEPNRQQRWVLATGGLLGLITLLVFFLHPLPAAWYANLGALQMARVELADWPTNEWDDGRHVADLTAAADLFRETLRLDPHNRTAHHRLGLIAMLERDYPTAVTHLEAAHLVDKSHPGIRKALGYSYVWDNQIDDAVVVLTTVPEARNEMEVYRWWWNEHGRDDLAAQATETAVRLRETNQ